MLFEFLQHSLQRREWLMIFQILVKESRILLTAFGHMINL